MPSLLALAFGLLGWFPLVVSAAAAQADTGDATTAFWLSLAGLSGGLSIAFGIVGAAAPPTVSRLLAALALVVAFPLAAVAVVFAVSFHW